MKTSTVIILIIFAFIKPHILIYAMKELFQMDWSNNYWAVFWLMETVSLCFKDINIGK